jgi:hypothetical protein
MMQTPSSPSTPPSITTITTITTTITTITTNHDDQCGVRTYMPTHIVHTTCHLAHTRHDITLSQYRAHTHTQMKDTNEKTESFAKRPAC